MQRNVLIKMNKISLEILNLKQEIFEKYYVRNIINIKTQTRIEFTLRSMHLIKIMNLYSLHDELFRGML